MLFKFQKIVGCIEPWVKNRDTNRIVSLCIVTALVCRVTGEHRLQLLFMHIHTYKNFFVTMEVPFVPMGFPPSQSSSQHVINRALV